MVKTEDSPPLPPGEGERPSQGYQLNENKKDVKAEPEQPDPDASYVLISSKPYAHPPIMDQMPADQRIALISDAVSYFAGNTDPASQEMLQNMLEAVRNLKSSKLASSASPSKPIEEAPAAGAQPAWPAYLANFKEAHPADAAMEDAVEDSPAKIAEANKVCLEGDEIDYGFGDKQKTTSIKFNHELDAQRSTQGNR